MTIHAYIGERASRTHENLMLQRFLESIELRWATSADWIYVVANSMWRGTEIDLVCLLPDGIVVADFKDYKGNVKGSENGIWSANGIVVKGGSKANPFVQIRDNKFSVTAWLDEKGLLQGRNLMHTAGAVIFSGPIEKELDLSPKTKPWFHVTDLDGCSKLLDAIASPSLSLSQDDAAGIVKALGVRGHRWVHSGITVQPIGGTGSQSGNLDTKLTDGQQIALDEIKAFLTDTKSASMSVIGMTSTGKSRLLSEAILVAQTVNRPCIVLAANRRLAQRANFNSGIGCSSIYSHLFDASCPKEVVQKKAGKVTRVVQLPISEFKDDPNCVYLIDEAQLLSDAYYVTDDGRQYGSGHLLSDFFETTSIGQSNRRVIFFGDPYQIVRGQATESVLFGGLQAAKAIPVVVTELNELIEQANKVAILHNAQRMVEALRDEKFAQLSLDTDDSFCLLDRGDAAAAALEAFKREPRSTSYIAETHAKTHTFNNWIRRKLLGKVNPSSLEAGDLVEVYSSPSSVGSDPFETRSRSLAGQRCGVVSVDPVSHSFEQQLKGRDAPIRFSTRKCRVGGEDIEVLEEFLLAEKPELTVDLLIALDVWSKSHPYDRESPHPGFARLRYGYGSTAHHAQGLASDSCFVDARLAAGRHTDAYFRWLYTAITRASSKCVLFNYEPIHAFDQFTWNDTAAKQVSTVVVGFGWTFDPAVSISASDQARTIPDGLSDTGDGMGRAVAIWLAVERGAAALGWRTVKISSHPWQVHLVLASDANETTRLRVAFNGSNHVTAMHVDDEIGNWSLLQTVAESCIESNVYDPAARTLLTEFARLIAPNGWCVLSAKESSYQLEVVVAFNSVTRVQCFLSYNKEGLVSSVRPTQCSTPDALNMFKAALH